MKKFLIFLLTVILIASSLSTMSEFGTPNSIATAIGLFRVCVLDEAYAQIGYLSKVYLGNPENGFDIFLSVMQDMGYIHHPEEQMGSMHWFTNTEGQWVKVLFYINAYYSKWIWC